MKVWIVHQHAGIPSMYGYVRHYYLGQELARRGHDVTVISSSFNHKTKTDVLAGHTDDYRIDRYGNLTFLWLRSRPYKGNDWRRIINLVDFPLSVWRSSGVQQLSAPDLIMASSPPPLAAYGALAVAHRRKIPFVLEIRDLWPETLIEIGNYAQWHPAIIALSWIEKRLYRGATRIITLLANSAEYMYARGARRGIVDCIPNGIDLSRVPKPEPKKENRDFAVLYAGSHGPTNALHLLIEAAKVLDRRNEDQGRIKLHLIGEGVDKKRLIADAEAAGLLNRRIFFHEPVPYEEIHARYAEADCFTAPLAESPLYKYGVAPNKYADYMAAGRPCVISTLAFNDPIKEAGAGISVPADNAGPLLADAYLKVLRLPLEERWAMGQRGRAYVEQNMTFPKLAERLEAALEAALRERPTNRRSRSGDNPERCGGTAAESGSKMP